MYLCVFLSVPTVATPFFNRNSSNRKESTKRQIHRLSVKGNTDDLAPLFSPSRCACDGLCVYPSAVEKPLPLPYSITP